MAEASASGLSLAIQQAFSLYSPLWGLLLLALAMAVVSMTVRRGFPDFPEQQSPSRIGHLDGLRGILAFAVFLTHAASTYGFRSTGVWQWPPSTFYVMCGMAPVSLFFMITGYLFWRRAIEGRIQLLDLYTNRFFRIVPLYLVAILIMVVFVGALSGWTPHEDLPRLVYHVAQWAGLRIFGSSEINRVAETSTIDTATWTLRPEALFYLALPLMAFLSKPKWFVPSAAVLVTAAIWKGGINGGGYWINFLFGMAAAHIHLAFPRFEMLKSKWAAIVAFGILAASGPLHAYSDFGLVCAAVAFPLFLCVCYGNDMFGLLRLRSVEWMGEISYSVYLMHGLVLFGLFWAVDAHVGVERLSPLAYWAFCAVAVLILMPLSVTTFMMIERPFMRLGKHLQQTRRSTAMAREIA
ncbi:MAG: acyltransferase [Caulobacteraceae bacterium]|nr:acyltransferase [Caulobacteraceae bacterium]